MGKICLSKLHKSRLSHCFNNMFIHVQDIQRNIKNNLQYTPDTKVTNHIFFLFLFLLLLFFFHFFFGIGLEFHTDSAHHKLLLLCACCDVMSKFTDTQEKEDDRKQILQVTQSTHYGNCKKVVVVFKLGNISQDWPCTVLLTESPVQEDLDFKHTAKVHTKKHTTPPHKDKQKSTAGCKLQSQFL